MEIQAIITQQEGTISCNFDQVKEAINERLAEYEDAVFTEDSKVLAKKTVASLRAEQKKFSDNLKEAKKKFMAPWEEFEPQAKELIALYDKPVEFINGQVKAFEERRINEKRQLIVQIHEEIMGEIADFLPLERIYNKRWENAGYKERDIRKDMISMAAAAQQALNTIRSMGSEAQDRAVEIYQQTLDLGAAISHITQYEAQKQEILRREEEKARRLEEERIRREERARMEAEREAERRERQAIEEERRKAEEALAAERARMEAEKAAAVEDAKQEAAQEAIESLIPEQGGEAQLYEYRMEMTDAEKEKLEIYMDSIGIAWEMI